MLSLCVFRQDSKVHIAYAYKVTKVLEKVTKKQSKSNQVGNQDNKESNQEINQEKIKVMKISDKAFKVFVYSGFGATCPIVVVTLAILLSGNYISSEAKFWVWIVSIISFAIMFLSLIRILCDVLPIDRLANKIRKRHHTSEVQATLDKKGIEEQKTSTGEEIQEENPLKTYFCSTVCQ